MTIEAGENSFPAAITRKAINFHSIRDAKSNFGCFFLFPVRDLLIHSGGGSRSALVVNLFRRAIQFSRGKKVFHYKIIMFGEAHLVRAYDDDDGQLQIHAPDRRPSPGKWEELAHLIMLPRVALFFFKNFFAPCVRPFRIGASIQAGDGIFLMLFAFVSTLLLGFARQIVLQNATSSTACTFHPRCLPRTRTKVTDRQIGVQRRQWDFLAFVYALFGLGAYIFATPNVPALALTRFGWHLVTQVRRLSIHT